MPHLHLRFWLYSMASSVLMALCFVPRACSQMIELREYHGKQIACARSGLFSFEMPCGLWDDFYPYVFVGTVISFTEGAGFEKTLRIVPGEIFLGDPKSELTVSTSQGACLPEIQPGDRWLFYLRLDENSQELVLSYGSPSAPEKQASADIERLRRLVHMSAAGTVIGRVTDSPDNMPRTNHKVTAKSTTDGLEYATTTDAEGDFQFSSLASGTYELSANTTNGLWTQDGSVHVKPHSCSSVYFPLHVDGRISGQILDAEGKPAAVQRVEIIPESDGSLGSLSRFTDEQGRYDFRGLAAGRYLIGINIDENVTSSSPRGPSLFYPGVRERRNAIAIEVTKAGEQAGVDFQLPKSKSQQ